MEQHNTQSKSSINHHGQWSHLVGKHVDHVEAIIHKESPELQIYKLRDGSPVTMDFRTDRIRIFIDENGNVTKAPIIG